MCSGCGKKINSPKMGKPSSAKAYPKAVHKPSPFGSPKIRLSTMKGR